jgi:lactate dehydrogenase-like 2-hydroxyacid dehydrogenase
MTQKSSRILVVAPIPPEPRALLTAEHELIEAKGDGPFPGFDIAVTTSIAGARRELMERLPDLKLLLCNGAGLENIDLGEASRRDIVVRNTPDAVTDDTADFAIGLIYATCRRIAEADRFVRAGKWTKGSMTPSRRVFDRKLGIVGLGKIGKTVAQRAFSLGMIVFYTGPRAKPNIPYAFVEDIGDLAAEVDILVLTCPGGPATHHLVNASVLERLGPKGILINVARGSVVDAESLIGALSEGKIGAAALDVFSSEPNPDPRLFAFDNVVLAPHYAAITVETRMAIAKTLSDAARDFRAGRPVQNAARAG